MDSTSSATRSAAAAEVARAWAAGRHHLSEPEGKALLRACGIPVPDGVLVADPREIGSAAAALTPPLVLKAVAGSLIHKSDAGAVVLGLADAATAAARAEDLHDALVAAGHVPDGWLVEEMAQAGLEVIVGAVRRPGVGFVVMVGLGGIFVEVLKDVALAVAPVDRADVVEMLAELRGAALLGGVRGRAARDSEALVDLIVRVAGPGGLLEQLPDTVTEVELNPVLVGERGAVAVDARFILANGPVEPAGRVDPVAPSAVSGPTDFARLFEPRSVAVVGASATGRNMANTFIAQLRAFGFTGPVHPVHPSAEQVEGTAAVRSFADLPGPVDYAYVAVPARAVADVLTSAAGRVGFAQVVSSGFSETGQGDDLDRAVLAAARQGGIRVLGPNCMGTHSTRGRLTFLTEPEGDPGPVSVVSQSGGLAFDVLRVGETRGLRFNKVVSIGNALDVSVSELVAHYLADDDTRVIGLYLESPGHAVDVADALRAAPVRKPVVLLAGGRTAAGARAAVSHTGALVDDPQLWAAVARQAQMHLTGTLDEFVGVLLALQMRADHARATRPDVVVFGNGGGTSVLAADALHRANLQVRPLEAAVLDRLREVGMPAGTALGNPIDAPAPAIAAENGVRSAEVLEILAHAAHQPALTIVHLNVGVIVEQTAHRFPDAMRTIVDQLGRLRDDPTVQTQHLLVLRSDGREPTERTVRELTARAMDMRIAVFREIAQAAQAGAGAVSCVLARTGASAG